jgi:hypothetical protein
VEKKRPCRWDIASDTGGSGLRNILFLRFFHLGKTLQSDGGDEKPTTNRRPE